MVATANRKDVTGRRSKASRRGGKQNSGRNAAQLAQKLRARGAAGSWGQTGSRPGPLRKLKKSRLSVTVVDDPARAAEQQAEQERQQKSDRVRKRRGARAAQEATHDEAQQAAEEQQLQRSAKVRRGSSKKKAANQDGAGQHHQGESERRKSKPPQHNTASSTAFPAVPQPDFDSVSDGEDSFSAFMVDEDGDELIVPAYIGSNTDLCSVFDKVLATPSDLKNDICATLDVYGGSAARFRLGCQLQGSRHEAIPGSDVSSKTSSAIYHSLGLTDENGVDLGPLSQNRANKIRRTAMLQHKSRYVLGFLNEKLKSMPTCTQAEADDPIFRRQYKASLFKENEHVSGITAAEVEQLRAPPPGMSHADLFILECCLLRFGITTVTAEDDEHRGDYFLCEEFRRAVTEILLQNGDHDDQAHGFEPRSDHDSGDGFPTYNQAKFGPDVTKSDEAQKDADADADTDSCSDSADSEEDAPPSEGAGDTDFVKTTPTASRHMDRILGGAVDITTSGYGDTKSVKAEMSEAKMSEKFNNVKVSVKYAVSKDDDPKKFFERFGFEVSQVDEALHFDKLKQTMKPTDVEAVTEALFEHVKSEPRYKQLKPKAQACFNFVFARDWLMNRDKRDITMYKIENRTAFDKLKQDKSKDPLAVQKFLLKLQEIQRKLGKDLCSNAMVRLQFLKGLNTALCKELMATRGFESLAFTRVYKRADRIWRTQIRANSFADANSGGNLTVADIEKKPDSLEAKFAALTPEQQLAVLNGKPYKKKWGGGGGGGGVKKGVYEKKGALDTSNSFLPLRHMQDSTFLKLYSKEQQKERQKLRADNGQPTKKPHLFEKDAWHGKKVCVDCRKIGHHAGECHNAASKHSKQLALMKAALKELKSDGDSE